MSREMKIRIWDHWNKHFVYVNISEPTEADIEALGVLAKCQKQLFTGLSDKNGKEIYEGDVVKYRWSLDKKYTALTNEIVFETAYARFNIKGWMGVISKGFAEIQEMEVIGNIFENSGLVKGNK